MSSAANIFEKFLEASSSGDFVAAAGYLADNYKFHGPLFQADNKKDYVEGTAQLAAIVRGHKMLRQWTDGDEACSVYDFHIETPKGKGSITMTDWTTVKNGKMVSSRLIFNTSEFVALMPEA